MLFQVHLSAFDQTQAVQELVEVVDGNVTGELLSDGCFHQDVLHNAHRAQLLASTDQDRLVDSTEVLKQCQCIRGEFHDES